MDLMYDAQISKLAPKKDIILLGLMDDIFN